MINAPADEPVAARLKVPQKSRQLVNHVSVRDIGRRVGLDVGFEGLGELRVVVDRDVEGRDRMSGRRTAAEHDEGKYRGRGERDWNPDARAPYRGAATALGTVRGI